MKNLFYFISKFNIIEKSCAIFAFFQYKIPREIGRKNSLGLLSVYTRQADQLFSVGFLIDRLILNIFKDVFLPFYTWLHPHGVYSGYILITSPIAIDSLLCSVVSIPLFLCTIGKKTVRLYGKSRCINREEHRRVYNVKLTCCQRQCSVGNSR